MQGEFIWIIGASAGIGRALAAELAHRGATLALSARNADALTQLVAELDGQNHLPLPLDVTDLTALKDAVKTLRNTWPKINRIVFMAGAYDPTLIADMDMPTAAKIVEVNLIGGMNVTHAVLPWLTEQNSGQIALCSSVAGFVGLPKGQPYSATKAGLTNFAESLKVELAETDIDVKVIHPGFVKTRLTDKNDFDMPMVMEADAAAKALADGLLSKGFEVQFPKAFTRIMKVLRALPYGLYFSVAGRMKA